MNTEQKIQRITEINHQTEANAVRLDKMYKMKLFLEGNATPGAYISFRENGGNGYPDLYIDNKEGIITLVDGEVEKFQKENKALKEEAEALIKKSDDGDSN